MVLFVVYSLLFIINSGGRLFFFFFRGVLSNFNLSTTLSYFHGVMGRFCSLPLFVWGPSSLILEICHY